MLGETPQQFRIHLFGQPCFTAGAEQLRFSKRPKSMPLLAYLLLHRDRPVSRDTLAFLLWEDETEERARANLRRHLHHLGSILPTSPVPWLLADNETVQWNPAADAWIDVAAFEGSITVPDRQVDAVDLYTGDLLEDLYDEWLFAPRERLRNLYLTALGELTIATRAARRFERATEFAQRILMVDPWREDIVRQLMAIRYESGDRAGALRSYEQFVRRLRDEVGADPMPETTALRDALLENASLPRPFETQEEFSSARTASALPFTGRDSDLERLRASWSRAARGRGGVVLVGGVPGIGKTRLVTEFAIRAEAEGGRVLWGSATNPESIPYQAFIEALRGALGLVAALDVTPLWLSALAQLIPELTQRRPNLPPLGAVDPEHEQTRLFEALMACLGALTKPRPLLIVLEDLHWAGSATIAALEFIARRAGGRAILIVGTYRDTEMPSALRILRRNLQQQDIAQHIALGHLPLDAVTEIVTALPGVDGNRNAVARKLYEASEGNPLFLGELIRDLTESGEQSLAQTLQVVISSRIARLSPDARFLLEIASVVGAAFDTDLTREILGWEESRLLRAVDELLSRHLVREAGRRAGFDYAFTHNLIRAAVYDRLQAETRVRWHHRIAGTLERIYDDCADPLASEIARHFEGGNDPQQAAAYYLRAARHAEALRAHEEALVLVSRAYTLAESEATRVELLLLRETIHRRQGDRPAQEAALRELVRLAPEPSAELSCEILHRRILLARSLSNRDQEAALIAELERIVSETDDRRWHARILIERAEYCALVNRFDDAEHAARDALSLHSQMGDLPSEVADLLLLGSIATYRGSLEEARRHLEQARALAERHGARGLVGDVLLASSSNAMMRHEFTECLELVQSAKDVFVALGDRDGEANALGRIATALTRLGRKEEARQSNLVAAAIFESIGKRQGLAGTLVNSGLIASHLGLLEDAKASYERAKGIFALIGDRRGEAICSLNLGCVFLQTNDPIAAKAIATRALELARDMKTPVYEAEALANLGAAERDLGDLDAAVLHMKAGLAHQEPIGRPSDRVNDQADLALAYLYKGDLEPACELVEEFLSAIEPAADPLWPQNVYWIASRIFRAAGRDAEWPHLLERAHATLKRMTDALAQYSEREAFLSLPMNRQIIDAYTGKRWPQARSTQMQTGA